MADLREQEKQILMDTISSAGSKLKKAYEAGPGGDPVVLEPAEATVIYRILTKQMHMRFK